MLRWPAELMPGGEWAGAVAFQYGGPGTAGGATWGLAIRDNRCEGEVTALAVQCEVQKEGFAIATGGTSGFQVAACRDPGVGAQAPGNGVGGRSGRLV